MQAPEFVEGEKDGSCTKGSLRKWLSSATCFVYGSHFVWAWGGRMWHFAVALFLIEISPGSLQLTAIYGLSTGGAILLFGPLIGKWIDRNPRLRVARVTIILRNLAVVGCASLVCLLIEFREWLDTFWGGWLMTLWQVIIVLVAVSVNLSGLGNRIAIQKDWIVEICDRDKDKLATMTAVLRRIDLLTKILAPIAMGQVMTFASTFTGAIFMAGWNILSLFVEYFLLWKVFASVPALANKKENRKNGGNQYEAVEVGVNLIDEIYVKEKDQKLTGSSGQEEDSGSCGIVRAVLTPNLREDDTTPKENKSETTQRSHNIQTGETRTTASPISLDTANSVEPQLNETNAGLAWRLSTNHNRKGCCHEDGGWFKVFGAFIMLFNGWRTYMRYGVAIAGVGLAFLYLTVLGFDNITTGYAYSQGLSGSLLGFLMGACALIGIAGTFAYTRIRRKIGLERTGLFSFSAEILCLVLCVGSIWAPGSPFDPVNWRENRKLNSPFIPCNTTTASAMNSLQIATPSGWSLNVNQSGNGLISDNPASKSPDVWIGMANLTSNNTQTFCRVDSYGVKIPESYISIGLLMAGIMTARFGLWITDLTVTQLILENVDETERGVVNGVQSSLNQLMNMLKYALVVAVPQPEMFGVLILVSFTAVSTGGVFYAVYSRKVRGHLLHPGKIQCGCQS